MACHGFISANKEGMIEEHLWMSTPLQPVFLKDFAGMNCGFRHIYKCDLQAASLRAERQLQHDKYSDHSFGFAIVLGNIFCAGDA